MKTKLILDVNKTQYAQLNYIVTGRVGDKSSNIVDVYVIDNGSPYNLTGLKVFFECTKPDSTAIRDDNGVKIIDATKGHFEYTFPVETFGALGKAKRAFFSIEKDTTTRATTQDFELVSLRNALDGNILSSHYISDFERISEEAEEVKELLDSTSKDINNAITELENKFDKAIEEGGVTPEVIIARKDSNGVVKENLKQRIDDDFIEHSGKIGDLEKSRELKNKLFKKSVFKKLPFRFPDYNKIVSTEDVTYIYPQAFTIDWDNKEIFVLYSPSGGASTKRWVVIFDLETESYKSCFSAGNAGGEGIVVKSESNGRFLYVKTQGSSLGKFSINTLPENLSTHSPIETFDVGMHWQFSYRNGTWLIEQTGAALGTYIRRRVFALFDDSFNRIGLLDIQPIHGGFFDSSYVDYVSKRQSIALGDGYIAQANGGYYGKGSPVKPYSYQGIKLLDSSGILIEEGLVAPDKMINKLEDEGFYCNRVELEGIHVSPFNDIYTLMIHQTYNTTQADQTGVIIFKEMSKDENTIDFSDIGRTYKGFSQINLETGVYPRSGDGNMYDPLTGSLFDSLDKILDFMTHTDSKSFSFYSSSVSVKDISGNVIPNGIYVTINNANNSAFFLTYFNPKGSKNYQIYGNGGSRTQVELFTGYSAKKLNLVNGATAFDEPRTPKIIIKSDGTRELTGLVNNVPKDGTTAFANLSSGDMPLKNMVFIAPHSASTSGGYATVSVLMSGRIVVNFISTSAVTVSLEGIRWLTTE